jgi:DNA-binding MarR family transcriptional regulator
VVDDQRERRDGAELQQIARLLSQAEQALTRRLATILEQEGCNVEQWRTLTLLTDGQSRAMSEIAEFALLPAPSLTRLVDRMVSDNVLYRRADPRDRRRVLVRITPRGQQMHGRIRMRMENDEALATLAAVHGTQLTGLLSVIIAHLRDP